MTYNKNH